MPLRLALMVAIGALLALGACSSDTKTVTAPAPMTDPDPDPGPAAATLPAAAASAFTRPRTGFGIGADDSLDTNGNRFRDVQGYRFTCEDVDGCRVVVTRDSAGALDIEVTSGTLTPGEVPAVTNLSDAGRAYRFLTPASGSTTATRGAGTAAVTYTREEFDIPAGMTRTRNQATLSCPAGGRPCTVAIEKRDFADASVDDVTDLLSTGGLTVMPAYSPWYVGLAYKGRSAANPTWDPLSNAFDLGSQISGFAHRISIDGEGETVVHVRDVGAGAGENAAPQSRTWGADRNAEIIGATTLTNSATNVFGGIAVLPDAFRGVATVGSQASIKLTLTGTDGAVQLSGTSFGAGDARTAAERWRDGFDRTMALGADTASDTSDDGSVHVRAFTDYATTGPLPANFGDHDATGGALVLPAGQRIVQVAPGGAVPSTPNPTQAFLANTRVPATFRGVPGHYSCNAACTVTTAADGRQTLSAGAYFEFTPLPGAQVVGADSDWLAFGTWALLRDDGGTRYGAFFTGSDPYGVMGMTFADLETGANTLTAATGDATYRGAAHGRYAEFDNGSREAGLFTATANFTAAFGDDATAGTLVGNLRNFSTTAYDAALTAGTAEARAAWRIDFASRAIANNDAYGFGLGALSGSWGAAAGQTLTGAGRARFYGAAPGTGERASPNALLGMFAATSAAHTAYDLTLIGAFGANRQP